MKRIGGSVPFLLPNIFAIQMNLKTSIQNYIQEISEYATDTNVEQ